MKIISDNIVNRTQYFSLKNHTVTQNFKYFTIFIASNKTICGKLLKGKFFKPTGFNKLVHYTFETPLGKKRHEGNESSHTHMTAHYYTFFPFLKTVGYLKLLSLI